jgi:hypothetical protein
MEPSPGSLEQPADPRRPKAGLRCPSPVCVLTLVLVEADFDRYEPPLGDLMYPKRLSIHPFRHTMLCA